MHVKAPKIIPFGYQEKNTTKWEQVALQSHK